jgi:hypothetical protein
MMTGRLNSQLTSLMNILVCLFRKKIMRSNQSTLAITKTLANNQTTNTVVMVSPDTFNYNSETADTNAFQIKDNHVADATEKALNEFNDMVKLLRSKHINVLVLPSCTDVLTPDAVFPNNWFSSHTTVDGQNIVVLYPMMAKNRRNERQFNALEALLHKNGLHINETIDLSTLEDQGCFLEGTGSLVLDHTNKIAYAALSSRTTLSAINQFCEKMGYKPITFKSLDHTGNSIYHTNMVMSVGDKFAVLAADTILDSDERKTVISSLEQAGKQIIIINKTQMANMASNILEVKSTDGHSHIIMSQTAHNAFTFQQLQTIKLFGEPTVVQINTIEKLGGGSARCMLAEIFNQKLNNNIPEDQSQTPTVMYKASY